MLNLTLEFDIVLQKSCSQDNVEKNLRKERETERQGSTRFVDRK